MDRNGTVGVSGGRDWSTVGAGAADDYRDRLVLTGPMAEHSAVDVRRRAEVVGRIVGRRSKFFGGVCVYIDYFGGG